VVYRDRVVTVYAQLANNLTPVAIGLSDMRWGSQVAAGVYRYDHDAAASTSHHTTLATGWHYHDLHQLEYSFQGAVQLETASARYLLPPQQAVWIPAGVVHQTTIRSEVRTVSAFFTPDMFSAPGHRVRVLAASAVMREMLLYGVRWPIDRPPGDPAADTFFVCLANLVADSLDQETPLRLPTSTDRLIATAIRYTEDHLDRVEATDVARAVGVSERTLRRKFLACTGMSWRTYLTQSRLLRAMALLAEPASTVLQVATAVGFDSLSSFTRAFTTYSGEKPSAYRRRVAR
jgi:AraC-like DNA-binding protein